MRFEVFNIEMKKGLELSYRQGLDADDYDPLCDHLIVRDLNSKQVVGTYRLLLGSKARKHFGFYSEREFRLDNIKKAGGELLELGRSCAHKDYRDKSVISFMWDAIFDYVESYKVRYIFGCASLSTVQPAEVSKLYAYLKARYYAPEEFRVYPVPEKIFPGLDESATISDEQAIFLRLPGLIKGYLRIGALLCGPPALDAEFGTTDLFLLLDVAKRSTGNGGRFGFMGSRTQNAID